MQSLSSRVADPAELTRICMRPSRQNPEPSRTNDFFLFDIKVCIIVIDQGTGADPGGVHQDPESTFKNKSDPTTVN